MAVWEVGGVGVGSREWDGRGDAVGGEWDVSSLCQRGADIYTVAGATLGLWGLTRRVWAETEMSGMEAPLTAEGAGLGACAVAGALSWKLVRGCGRSGVLREGRDWLSAATVQYPQMSAYDWTGKVLLKLRTH